MTVGQMIRAGMDRAEMTAPQLAEAVGLARHITVYDWTGGRVTPSPEALGRICRVLGLDPTEAARAAWPEVWTEREGEG